VTKLGLSQKPGLKLAAANPVRSSGSSALVHPENEIEVSVVLPCLNEAETVGTCVRKAIAALKKLAIDGEVIVVDNGSEDGSPDLARAAGARVVSEPRRGYGSALIRGFEEACAPYIIMADADDSYDLSDLEPFVSGLRKGADLVMGSRRRGTIKPGAMPWHHRWIGNPVLSGILNFFFNGEVSDAHCGMRGISKDAYRRMRLRATGMEFASEMVVKASLAGMSIAEVPITLHRDGRKRPPHLRSFRDGWRHLRFMLLLSPTHLFVLPGLICMFLGMLPLIALGGGPMRIGPLSFDIHYMILGSLLTILGYQILTTGLFAKVYSHSHRLYAPDRALNLIRRYFNLERGLITGGFTFLVGFLIDAVILDHWLSSGMGSLNAVRPALQASTLMIIGAQTVCASFFLAVLDLAAPEEGPG
jgi:glycosyltransferase involved in cell wall biosynthesis